MWQIVLIILAVFGIALIYPNIGLGGGFLHVPVLMYLAGMDNGSAVPVSLTLVLAGALAAFPKHHKSGNVDTRLAAYLASGAVFGAVIGTFINLSLNQSMFELLFAFTIILVCIKMLFDLMKGNGSEKADDCRMCTKWISASVGLAFLAGILASLFGIGGGLIFVPTMIYLLGRPTKLAAGTSTLAIVPTATVGLLTYYFTASAEMDASTIWYIVCLIPVALIGAYLGSKYLSSRLTGTHIKAIFIALSMFVAITMIAMAFI